MKQSRPASVLVIAILHLVFGCIWLLCGLFTLGMQASGMNNMFMNMSNVNPGNNPQLAKQQELNKEVMKFSQEMNSSPGQYAALAQYLVLSVLMIVSAIGLLRMQSWGRTLSLVYGTLSILSNIALAVYIWMVNIPAVQAFADRMGTHGQEFQAMAGLMKFGAYFAIVTPVLSLIYPTIVLILMFRPSVAAAFRGEATAPVESSPGSEHIQEDDRWGRG